MASVSQDCPSTVSDETKTKKKIQSSIAALTVGDERKCFNQIRKAAGYIEQDSLLWNGWTAGKFALEYVIGHHMKRKKKAEEKLKQQSASTPEPKKRRPRKRGLDKDMEQEVEVMTQPTVGSIDVIDGLTKKKKIKVAEDGVKMTIKKERKKTADETAVDRSVDDLPKNERKRRVTKSQNALQS